jgi:hypothetical protein
MLGQHGAGSSALQAVAACLLGGDLGAARRRGGAFGTDAIGAAAPARVRSGPNSV